MSPFQVSPAGPFSILSHPKEHFSKLTFISAKGRTIVRERKRDTSFSGQDAIHFHERY